VIKCSSFLKERFNYQEVFDLDLNTYADFWFYNIGVNVIAADTVNKKAVEEWSKYQNNPVSPEL